MANFSVNNSAGAHQTITATYKTLLDVTAVTSGRRGKIYDVTFGTLGTPADQSYEWDISRVTALGTAGSNPVPAPLDPADSSAASTVGGADHTAEPTYTAATSMFYLATNQRASYRWVASPGSELVWPVTNLNGLGIRTRSVSGGSATASGHFLFQEQ